MKKILIAVVIVVGAVGAYLLLQKRGDDTVMTANAPTATSSPNTPSTASAASTYKDGEYTSDTVQTDRGYGPVQIKLVVSGGKIADVQFLQMPSLPGHTEEVTAMAEPILKQEAIAKQSSQVDIVSGATQDTEAFQQALASALAMAK